MNYHVTINTPGKYYVYYWAYSRVQSTDFEYFPFYVVSGSSSASGTSGWSKSNGSWYYYTNGVKATGWKQVGGTWYYFNGSGEMQTGWQQIGGVWYCFDSNGRMYASQWNGKYYLKSSGAMATGWTQIGSDWYYFNTSGIVRTGWLQSGSSWYYLDPNNNGRMVYSCTMTIDGTSYTFNSSGKWVS